MSCASNVAIRFSLIVASKHRFEPLMRLFESIAAQARSDLEVILVDQNETSLLPMLAARAWPFPLRHIHQRECGGASGARNRGLPLAQGDVLIFPDDDCWYPPEYLTRLDCILRETGAGLVTGRAADLAGRTINGRFQARRGFITRATVFTSQIEWNMAVSASLMRELRGYDEAISLGGPTPWQGGEGYDVILRALDRQARCFYDPALVAHHDELPVATPDARMVHKGLVYARGLGYVLRKHGYGPWAITGWVARSLINLAWALLLLRPDQARYFSTQARGRIEGWTGRVDHPAPSDATTGLAQTCPADAVPAAVTAAEGEGA